MGRVRLSVVCLNGYQKDDVHDLTRLRLRKRRCWRAVRFTFARCILTCLKLRVDPSESHRKARRATDEAGAGRLSRGSILDQDDLDLTAICNTSICAGWGLDPKGLWLSLAAWMFVGLL